MRSQTILFPDREDERKELFYRGATVKKSEKGAIVPDGAAAELDTYMNLFDAGAWRRFTGISDWKLCFRTKGVGKILLYRFFEGKKDLVAEKKMEESGSGEISFGEVAEALYAVRLEAVRGFVTEDIYFEAERAPAREIRIGVVICTYRRERQLLANLEKLKQSLFFQKGEEIYGKLRICVVDNAGTLPEESGAHLTILHHANTGGSGGFSRGMEYMRAQSDVTNVLLMDDDVEFETESFYRLYVLLSYGTEELQNRVVAGRMFRTDCPYVQYTKTEIWNRGEILHMGFMQDMRQPENLLFMNQDEGEYAGWWFACFPFEFVKKEAPLPFFLHCDDVEYGLRFGGTPVALNGIQVWHETYEYRQSPVILYYDVRNSLIVNAVRGSSLGRRDTWRLWMERLQSYAGRGEMENCSAVALGLLDFSKGGRWFFKLDVERHHKRLRHKIEKMGKLKRKIFCRIAFLRLMVCYKGVLGSYGKMGR